MPRPLPSEFAPIREALSGVPLQQIMEATGVSTTATSKIRSGKLVPHVGTGRRCPRWLRSIDRGEDCVVTHIATYAGT
jgi:hypothetical protein